VDVLALDFRLIKSLEDLTGKQFVIKKVI